MNNLCIIPARGGSKRIPRKNIKDFLGKPIISYSINAALESGIFDEVMVSTDDLEIAEIARQYGAKIPFMRSKKTADDFAVLLDVVLEVVKKYETAGIKYDNICCILPTAPLISSQILINGYNKLLNSSFTSVIPIVKFSYPIMRSLEIDEHDRLKMKWKEYLTTRSQDIPPAYHDSGMFYWIKKRSLFEMESFVSLNSTYLILDELVTQDIDTENDWLLAELKYKIIFEK